MFDSKLVKCNHQQTKITHCPVEGEKITLMDRVETHPSSINHDFGCSNYTPSRMKLISEGFKSMAKGKV